MTQTKSAASAAKGRLIPPADGATVRMYRTGHGDCFLLAFAGDQPDKPVYVLIDCGYKPGSPKDINTTIKDIAAHIATSTGGHIDVAVITHEHQDHVNGITKSNFKDITIGETWLAWTEDPEDDMANALRAAHKDKLLGLVAARNRLAADGDKKRVEFLDEFLAFELGAEDAEYEPGKMGRLLGAAAKDPAKSANKQSMKIFKDRAKKVRYLRPHESVRPLAGAKHARAFVLGPPRDPELLSQLDPEGREEFHGMGFGTVVDMNDFYAAFRGEPRAPFSPRFTLSEKRLTSDPEYKTFFREFYGAKGGAAVPGTGRDEVAHNADWRRIDAEWLYSAEQLALDMNDETNNASLVLAFELGKKGKVLLFAADAQRGNWISWGRKDWKDGGDIVTAKDLLSRAVLYKVGHHGSHNATLNGSVGDPHANLSWMATGDHGTEFTAMITAVRSWAETKKGWDHPLKAIKDALLKKASGRVFQTDTDFDKMVRPTSTSAAEWKAFQSRCRGDRLFFDYDITP